MRHQPMTDMAVKLAVQLALQEALAISREEPHKVFWLHVLRCPGCRRHAAGLAITSSDMDKPKYVLATVTNGEVIPRGPMGRH